MNRFFGKEALKGFLFLLVLTGCASMDSYEFKQPVKLLSDPPGAKVFSGPEYLGTTPGYIRVPREKEPRLTFVFPNGEKQQAKLETSYRWGGSFASNLIFFQLAPAGWAWDLYRGTAWNLDDPGVFRQNGSKQWPKIIPPKVVAIAPPIFEQRDKINSLGLVITEKLRATEPFKILAFDKTEEEFRSNRSYQGLSDRESDRRRLYTILRADHILESKVEKQGDSYRVRAELRDVVSGNVYRVYNWEVTPPAETDSGDSSFMRLAKRSFHLIPNTIFITAAGYTPHLDINRIEYDGKESPSDSSFEKVLDKISTIGVARLDRGNFDVRGHWVFDFVPLIFVSKKNLIFKHYAPLIGTEFERWVASAGYGIEAGYIGRYGFVYIDYIPSVTWTKVKFDGPAASGSASGTRIAMHTELGYAYFFTRHIVGRIFGRYVTEDKEAWSKAVNLATGVNTAVGSASSTFAGLSIGYYFDSAGKREGWRIR